MDIIHATTWQVRIIKIKKKHTIPNPEKCLKLFLKKQKTKGSQWTDAVCQAYTGPKPPACSSRK